MNEAAIVAVGLATVEHFSNTDKVVPEVTHEATPEAGNDSVERETTLNLEPPQREHEVDLNVPETEGTLPDIDPTPVPLPLEPENSHIQTELVAECGIEATPTATTNSFPIDTEVQPDPSLGETAPNAQKDIEEAQTQVGDTSDIKDEPIPETDIAQHIEAADAESVLEDVPASSTNESQNTVRLEPEIDFVAPAEEEPSAITQVAAEDLLPKIESEGAISGTPDETIPIPDDVTASVANVEDQIIAPVDIESEHAAVVQVSSTDELTEAILPTNAEESPENLTPLVEPPHKSSDDEVVEVSVLSHFNVSQKLKLTLRRAMLYLKWMSTCPKPMFLARPRLCRSWLPPPQNRIWGEEPLRMWQYLHRNFQSTLNPRNPLHMRKRLLRSMFPSLLKLNQNPIQRILLLKIRFLLLKRKKNMRCHHQKVLKQLI